MLSPQLLIFLATRNNLIAFQPIGAEHNWLGAALMELHHLNLNVFFVFFASALGGQLEHKSLFAAGLARLFTRGLRLGKKSHRGFASHVPIRDGAFSLA